MDKPQKFDKQAYDNKYIAEHYDRINFFMPKGIKEEIKLKAKAKGMSMSEYLLDLVKRDIPVKGYHIDPDRED